MNFFPSANFAHPALFLLLIPALLAVFARFRARTASFRSGDAPLLASASRSWRVRFRVLPEVLETLALILSIYLLACPQRFPDPAQESAEGLAIALVIDRSSSMQAIIPYGGSEMRRIDGVKAVTRDFLSKRTNDQFSLITFARYPETNTPLTPNRSVLADFLQLVELPETEAEDGTAIGDALVLASAHLDEKGIVILLTDGQNNRGETEPAEAAKIAAAAGVTVYTIGLGGDGYVMQDSLFGMQPVGVPVSLDEKLMTAIAEQTGGRYYRADNLDELARFYTDIAERETVKLRNERERRSEPDLEAGLALLLALLVLIPVARHLLLKRMDP